MSPSIICWWEAAFNSLISIIVSKKVIYDIWKEN